MMKLLIFHYTLIGSLIKLIMLIIVNLHLRAIVKRPAENKRNPIM